MVRPIHRMVPGSHESAVVIVSAAPLPFSQFVHGFVGAYTMAIHVGWLLGERANEGLHCSLTGTSLSWFGSCSFAGNGLHAVNANSLESLNLFMWAKFVFGALAWLEALSMLGLSSLGSPTQLRFSVLFSTMLGAIQIWSFICIRRMQATLAEVTLSVDSCRWHSLIRCVLPLSDPLHGRRAVRAIGRQRGLQLRLQRALARQSRTYVYP